MDNQAKNIERLQVLLNIYTVQEIIAIFSSIDGKIQSLHECSSSDFLNINALLRQYHKQARQLSEHANEMLATLKDGLSLEPIETLPDFHQKLNKQTIELDKNFENLLQQFEKILSQLELMEVPLKNYRQNLITLKFIVTNLRLCIAYSDKNLNPQVDNDTAYIEKLIEQLKTSYTQVDDNLLLLRGTVKHTINKVKRLHEKYYQQLKVYQQRVSDQASFMFAKQHEAIKSVELMLEYSQHCFKNINSIITSLQYQDIISQKMQHVQLSYKDLLQQLGKTDGNDMEQLMQLPVAQQLLQLPDIAELQVAQLVITNKEYQYAIENITKKIIETEEDINCMANLSRQFDFEHVLGDPHDIAEMASAYKNINEYFQLLLQSKKSLDDEINTIIEAIKSLTKNIKHIADFDSELNTVVQRTQAVCTAFQVKNDNLEITLKQIGSISAEINDVKNHVGLIFDKLLALAQGVSTMFQKLFKQKTFLQNFSKHTKAIENAFKQHYDAMSQMQQKNIQLINEAVEMIKPSLQHVRYYDYFESVMEEIISELNTINCKIKLNSANINESIKQENLKHIEQLYTMRSERLVHQHVSNGKELEEELLNKKIVEKSEEQDDIELF